MKNKLLLTVTILITLLSCNNRDDNEINQVKEGDLGTISLSAVIKDVDIASSVGRTSLIEGVLSKISIEIFNVTGETVLSEMFNNLSERIELPVGEYTLVFYTPQVSAARFDEGYYGSRPQITFEVVKDVNTQVPVELRLFDVATTIDFSDELLQNYPDIKAEATLVKENESLTLEWSAMDDMRTGYLNLIQYVPGNGGGYSSFICDLEIKITALDSEGNQVMVTKSYPEATANQHYKLSISYVENSTVEFDISIGDAEIIEDEIPFPDGSDESNTNNDTSDESIETTTIAQGDLIITEIMNNPDIVSDSAGEWFEVYNTTVDKMISMNGLKITGATSEFTIEAELSIAPGSYVVLGRNGDAATNGGVTVDYVYSSFTLANSSGSITLFSEENEIDKVVYDTFSSAAGKSMQLNANTLGHLENDTATNWCLPLNAFGAGDFGSPGSLNEICN